METFFQRIIDRDFEDLQGLTAELSIPIRQPLINELIAIALRGNKNIESCQVSVHPQNRVSVDARVKTPLLPLSLNVQLKLDTSVDFASYSSPKLRAWMENNRFLGSLGSMFNVLPEGIKIYGDQVVVDLGSFLRTPEQKKYLALVKSADISTEEGKVNLGIRVQIDR